VGEETVSRHEKVSASQASLRWATDGAVAKDRRRYEQSVTLRRIAIRFSGFEQVVRARCSMKVNTNQPKGGTNHAVMESVSSRRSIHR
jgi:hypothetical protein